MPDVDVVTGAFGYTGRYITGRLLESGRNVKTLTGHPNRPSPFGDQVGVAPFDFDDRRQLVEHGVDRSSWWLHSSTSIHKEPSQASTRGSSPTSGGD
jgi:nucleoside-diphosphate-sugar epimerase